MNSNNRVPKQNNNNSVRRVKKPVPAPKKQLGAEIVSKRPPKKNNFIKPANAVVVKGNIDRPMLIIILLLIAFGTIMVFSSSFATALTQKEDSFYYIKRQSFFMVLGISAMIIVCNLIDYKFLRRISVFVFSISFLLLIFVLIFGNSRGEATRWINIGPISFQPSEVMKTALVLLLAHYFATFSDRVTNYRDFRESSIWGNAIPYAIVVAVCGVLALEHHFSGVIIMFLIGTVVIYLAGARKFWMVSIGSVGAIVVSLGILFTDYAKQRVDIWLHPENFDVRTEVWQTVQGLNAVGSGGFLGVGLGNSYQKYNYVSEAQNDFIFSIVCEELGFVGAICVIALFVLFIWRGYIIAMKAPDTFSSLVVAGIVSKVGIQAVLNIAVVTNTIPNTGISLPFFSYGGTSLLLLLVEMGIVLSISRYSYQDKA